MNRMTKAQAESLTAFIMRVRPEWRPAGIMAALEKASPGADVFDVARAMVNLASEPSVLTPGLLPAAGPHWRKPNGETPARRGDHDQPCPDHPEHDHPCPECRAEADALDEAARLAAAADVRAALANAAKYKPPMHIPKPAATPHDEHLARARARIEQEKRK